MFQERDLDNDLMRAWHYIVELGEQLSHNQKIVATLQNQTNQLKNQAIHNGTGYALRRFNVDLSKESFESELERSNAQIIIENQTLLHENKQLSLLLKEYEQTLENVMGKFRNHAVAAQQHELTLTRHYETLLLSRETNTMSIDLSNNANVTASLQRLSHYLRMLLRSVGGEEPEDVGASDGHSADDGRNQLQGVREDWALERECEIARLETENEELRRVLGIDSETSRAHGVTDEDLIDRRPCILHHPTRQSQSLMPEAFDRNSPGPPQPQSSFGGAPLPGNGGNIAGMPDTSQIQRTLEVQPGMRAGTLRRPAMFGRGRGSGPPSIWGLSQERVWANLHTSGNDGSSIDLSG